MNNIEIGQRVWALNPKWEYFISYMGYEECYLSALRATEGNISAFFTAGEVRAINLSTNGVKFYTISGLDARLTEVQLFDNKEDCIERNKYWVDKLTNDYKNIDKLERKHHIEKVVRLAEHLNVKIKIIED
jgi:hypothetical protein